MEPELLILVGYNFGRKALQLNREIISRTPGERDTSYRISIIDDVYPKLQEVLLSHYLSNMSQLVNEILNKRGEHILEQWDIEKAQEQFKIAFTNVELDDYSLGNRDYTNTPSDEV